MGVDFQRLIKEGNLDECLVELTAEVKKNPADVRQRIFLFQLLSVLGQWERALTQLNVAAEMDASSLLMGAMYRPALAGEAYRAEVYFGQRDPVIFGDPEDWMSWLVGANRLQGEGESEAAAELRGKAFEAAPAVAGSIDGKPFEWIADADVHFGPFIEAIIQNNHYWVPYCRIRQIEIEPPMDLRDMVWAPAQFVWTNGGEVFGLIPVRYPGSHESPDPAIRLARKTEWSEIHEGVYRGLGQRLLATNEGDVGLLEARHILLDHGEAEEADPTEA